MTYKELFDKLLPSQLNDEILVYVGDEETGTPVYADVQGDSFYWLDGDCYGDLPTTEDYIKKNKEEFPDDDLSIEDFTLVLKGTLFIHLDQD